MSTPSPKAAVETSFTTQDVNKMLWNRYTERGEYVVLFDVPDIVGIHQQRRCDAVAIGMWQSSGHLIHGFEVKVSRSDWLRELKNVTKADPFIERCDRWWLVTADVSIARPEEIPEAWGWMTATKNGLRIQRPPQPLPQDGLTMRRLWAFALIRRAAEPKASNSHEFQAMLAAERARIERRAEQRIEQEISRAAPAYEKLRQKVEEFEKASGMKLEDWHEVYAGDAEQAAEKCAERFDCEGDYTIIRHGSGELWTRNEDGEIEKWFIEAESVPTYRASIKR